MISIRAWFLLLTLTMLLGACASTGARRTPPASTGPEPGLYGLRGGELIRVDPAGSGSAAGAGSSAPLADVTALTYDPHAGRFYGIAGASSEPTLIAVDATTGEAEVIGAIEVRGLDINLAEAIAFHPGERELYGAGGKSSFASSILFVIDPATAEGHQVARVRGTIQDEIDAMAFAGDVLYAIDGAGGSSALYRVDAITGEASRIGQPFSGTVTDLAFDPAARRLFAVPSGAGEPLLALSPEGTLSELPLPGEFGAPVTAVACIAAPGTMPFGDGFESGTVSAWSRTSEPQENR